MPDLQQPSAHPAIEPSAQQTQYLRRMRKVLDHIDAHIDGDMSIEALAAVAAFSPFHFHRQFTALFGVSVHDHVRQVRMKRASYRLAFRDDGASVMQIALDSGYASPEAFARAFKQQYGQPPSVFRAQPDWASWHAAHQASLSIRSQHMPPDLHIDQVRIVDFPETRVAVLSHEGDPALLGDTIRRFIAWRKQVGLPPSISATFNILHTDPDTTPPQHYRLDLCAATDQPIAPNEQGVTEGRIPGGRCAVVRQTGSPHNLRASAELLYGQWLPMSGEEARDFTLFAQRISFFPDVPEHEAATDVFLPLKPRS